MGHSHSLPHLQCCSLAHERLALEMASLQVKEALVVQNHILSCQPTWTSAIRWSDTSFQNNQQLFGSIISLKHTHKHRERERERNIQARKEHQEPTPTTWWFVKSHWLEFSCFVTLIFNILHGDFQFGRCDAYSESAKARAQCSRWPSIYVCLLGDLKPFQILPADFNFAKFEFQIRLG